MNFKFSYRPYSGKQFRPTPEVHTDDKTLIVATPWGNRDAAKKSIDRILEYLILCNEDREATTPFQRLSCLSTGANNLRVAALLANESIYREDNNIEYRNGVELFAMSLSEGELVWIQIGQPQILLARKSRQVISLAGSMDLSFDMSDGDDLLPSLPNQLLGLDSSMNLTINSFRPQDQDQLVLLSHSQMPREIYQLESDELKLDTMSQKLSRMNPQLAFWLGLIAFSQN
jgi:hypothetical protein